MDRSDRKAGGRSAERECRAFTALVLLMLSGGIADSAFAETAGRLPDPSSDRIVCETMEARPLPPGTKRWTEFVSAIPSFILVETWRDAEGREHESREPLLSERTACGVDYSNPLWQEPQCQVFAPFPDPSVPNFGKYYLTWDCGSGGSASDRVAGSVSITLGRPGSAFRCQVTTPSGPIGRAVFLQGCRKVSR